MMSALITLLRDVTVEPGHQVLAIDTDTVEGVDGFYLASMLLSPVPPEEWSYDEQHRVLVPHTADVDRRIVDLINELAHVRYSAPEMVQLTLKEAEEPES
jgi:hypothetical protein